MLTRQVLFVPRFGATAAVAATLVILHGCGSDSTPRSNLPPTAQLTHGPVEGGEASYAIRVAWTGEDPDGYVAFYEIAVDPPAAFTEAEIAEGGPGITSVIREGAEVGSRVRRVSKVVDGQTVSFDWEITGDFSRRFWFSTPRADSSGVGEVRVPLPRYSGTHVLYVRAVDDDEAVSTPDRVAFTATTVTPSTWLTRPGAPNGFVSVNTGIRFEWAGEDPDAPRNVAVPAGYEYKLVDLSGMTPPVPLWPQPDPGFILNTLAARFPWTRVLRDSTGISFSLTPAHAYIFGVRAIDAAGAVDPFLAFSTEEKPGNAVLIQAGSVPGFPRLILREATYQTWTATRYATAEVEFPLGLPLEFTWGASGESYGGVIDGYRYGIDTTDPEAEGPDSGWSEWSTLTHPLQRISFDTDGLRVARFAVQARDDLGGVTTLELHVTTFDTPHDRPILLVDDAKDGVFPRDSERDAFWHERMVDSHRFDGTAIDPAVYRWDSHGPNDTFFLQPTIPSPPTLGRYRLVVYDCDGGAGFGGFTGLSDAGPRRGYLGGHLRTGGQLWITGQLTTAAMVRSSVEAGDPRYPGYSFQIEPGSFPWEYMKIYSDRVETTKDETTNVHGLIRVEPFPGRPEVFPAMELDPSKMRLAGYGVGNCDMIFDPIFQAAEPTFRGQIDSLYIYRAIGPTQPEPRSSVYDRRLNAIRWHDPDPNRAHGRTMWFGFPVYHLKNDQFQETFNRAVDWFREEQSWP